MKINFIGSFSTGYVGEVADETHLANELEYLGHNVKRIPRDIWKARVEGNELDKGWEDIVFHLKADINIICKWPHFSGKAEADILPSDYIQVLRHRSEAPVFYWVWDYMWDQGIPQWHLDMAKAADLYLSNEAGIADKYYQDCHFYYFPFDCADATIDKVEAEKRYDVTFFGTYLGQGDRASWLPELNKAQPIKVFSWNWQEWKDRGFDAEPAVWGKEFAQKVAESKIILGFNVNDHCWGYWSNRTGKVLCTGGFLLQRYVPGMELFLRDGAEYFSSIEEANKKINYYLNHRGERERIAQRGYEIGRDKFTSRARIKELIIVTERYIKGGMNANQSE